MNENSSECEIAYDTALWMLYAILDETMQEGVAEGGLEDGCEGDCGPACK